MRLAGTLLALAVVAAACGGDPETTPGADDYFSQLARISGNAAIQERGLKRDLRIRLEKAELQEDRVDVVVVFVDQSARLYRDVVDALGGLDAPADLLAPQAAYADAWRAQLDNMVKVRDEVQGVAAILRAIDTPLFRDAAAEIRERCDELQAAVQALESDVDLRCDGRS
jgi:hypothetical protein